MNSNCIHDGCNGRLLGPMHDEALPPMHDSYECAHCGEVYIYSRAHNELEIAAPQGYSTPL